MGIGLFSSFIRRPHKCNFFGEDEGEEILLIIRRHVITNLDWIIITILLFLTPFIAAALLAALNTNPFASAPGGLMVLAYLFWYLFTFGFAFQHYLNWFFNVHIITNKRVVDMDFHGLLYRNVAEAPLRNIEDVTHSTSGAGQIIFHYGDVMIQTAGEKRELDFRSIPNPAKVQDIISDLVSALRVSNDRS